jgi:hypothetical protein
LASRSSPPRPRQEQERRAREAEARVKQQQAPEAQRATGEKRMALEREQKEVAARQAALQAGLQAAAQVQGKAEAGDVPSMKIRRAGRRQGKGPLSSAWKPRAFVRPCFQSA